MRWMRHFWDRKELLFHHDACIFRIWCRKLSQTISMMFFEFTFDLILYNCNYHTLCHLIFINVQQIVLITMFPTRNYSNSRKILETLNFKILRKCQWNASLTEGSKAKFQIYFSVSKYCWVCISKTQGFLWENISTPLQFLLDATSSRKTDLKTSRHRNVASKLEHIVVGKPLKPSFRRT